MDFEKAMLHPAAVFSSPEAVCGEASLSREQKIRILRQWEYDARELEVAEEENMSGGPPDQLDQVLKALRQLGATADDSGAPTKQG